MYFHFTKVISYKTISKIANIGMELRIQSYGMEERHHFHKPSTFINKF